MTSTRKNGLGRIAVVLLSLVVILHAFGICIVVIATSFPTFYKRAWTYYSDILAEIPHEEVAVTRRDGQELSGLFFRNEKSRKAVLLCHGRSRKKTHAMPYVLAFMDDYNVLTFDFRSHGENPYGTTSIGYHEADDVLGALDWLAKEGMSEVALVGHSMGAAAALHAAGQYGGEKMEIAAMVTEGAFSSLAGLLRSKTRRLFVPATIWWPAFRISEHLAGYSIADNVPQEWIRRVTCPVLILQAKGDQTLPADSAERLAAQAEDAQVLYFNGEHDVPCGAVVRLCRAFVRQHL